MIEAPRRVTFRDFLIFQLKLLLDGMKDVVLFQLSIIAMVLDLFRGGGPKPRYFYGVLRMSERFDLWLNLNGAMDRLEADDVEGDGLFGASDAGADTLLGTVEEWVRGGDEPRGRRRRRRESEPPPATGEDDDSPATSEGRDRPPG
jgi:hypothetical protein